MEFFLDTADVDEIREIAAWGILDGVNNQPVAHQEVGPGLQEVVREIAGICSGPISAEVTAMDTAGMVDQGRALKAELPENVIIKFRARPKGWLQRRFSRRKASTPTSPSSSRPLKRSWLPKPVPRTYHRLSGE